MTKYLYNATVPCHEMAQKGLVAGLLPQRAGFDPMTVHMDFMAEKVVLGQICLRAPQFLNVSHSTSDPYSVFDLSPTLCQ
jgi:hypothetical protein